MPDKTQKHSRTGEMPAVEEPRLDLERDLSRPTHVPEAPKFDGSTTGVMPLPVEGTDDPTDRDKDTDV